MGRYVKNNDNTHKGMQAAIIVLATLLLICVAMLIVLLTRGADRPQETEPEQTQSTGALDAAEEVEQTTVPEVTDGAQTTAPEETDATQTPAVGTEDTEMIRIETPYIDLGYPAEWGSYLGYEPKMENGVFTESFYCLIGEEKVPLFDIHFGSEELGTLRGYVLVDGEKIPVSYTPYEYVPDETWREDDVYVLYAMQEGLNDVLRSVMENAAFLAQ